MIAKRLVLSSPFPVVRKSFCRRGEVRRSHHVTGLAVTAMMSADTVSFATTCFNLCERRQNICSTVSPIVLLSHTHSESPPTRSRKEGALCSTASSVSPRSQPLELSLFERFNNRKIDELALYLRIIKYPVPGRRIVTTACKYSLTRRAFTSSLFCTCCLYPSRLFYLLNRSCSDQQGVHGESKISTERC